MTVPPAIPRVPTSVAAPKGVLLLSTYEVNVALTPGEVLLLTKNVTGPEPSKPVLVYLRVRAPPAAAVSIPKFIPMPVGEEIVLAPSTGITVNAPIVPVQTITPVPTLTDWVLQEAGVQAPLKTTVPVESIVAMLPAVSESCKAGGVTA